MFENCEIAFKIVVTALFKEGKKVKLATLAIRVNTFTLLSHLLRR